MKLIPIAGRSSVQNISSSSCELLSVGCSHSEFPILLHPIFGSCHSQCPALSWVFICSSPDLVYTICTSLAIFHAPEFSPWNVWFLCYSINSIQKMMWHYFWSGSVHVCEKSEKLELQLEYFKFLNRVCTYIKATSCSGLQVDIGCWPGCFKHE